MAARRAASCADRLGAGRSTDSRDPRLRGRPLMGPDHPQVVMVPRSCALPRHGGARSTRRHPAIQALPARCRSFAQMSTPAFGAPPAPAGAGLAEPGGAHELKTLILSRHPAIAIETTEEERLDTLLAAVAAETHLTIFEWTITRGLMRRPGAQVVYGTTDPLRMLAAICELAVDGLYVLKDF